MSERSIWEDARERLAEGWEIKRRPAEEVLRERAAQVARALEPPSLPTASDDLCVHLGGALVRLPASAVASAERLGSLTAIPGSPPQLLGLARRRGTLVPVFDLGPVLTGAATERGPQARLVTLVGDGPELVVVVESIEGSVPGVPASRASDGPASLVHGLSEDGALHLDVSAVLRDPRFTLDHSDEL